MTHQEYIKRRDEIVQDIFYDGYESAIADGEYAVSEDEPQRNVVHATFNEAIDQLCLDVIGEDEPIKGAIKTYVLEYSNNEKAEQRRIITGGQEGNSL